MDAGMHMGVGVCTPLFPARASYTHAGARAGTDAGVGVQGEQGPTQGFAQDVASIGAGMSAGEDTSAGVATKAAQGFAQDVASIVCKHLENHRLGQLDMKVVLERQLSNRQKTQKRVEAIPFRAGIMGNAVHWCVLQPLRDPDSLCSRDKPCMSFSYLQTVCYTTQAAAEQMCKGMLFYNSRVKIEVNTDAAFKGLKTECTCLGHDAQREDWVKKIDLKLQTCARQSVVISQKTGV